MYVDYRTYTKIKSTYLFTLKYETLLKVIICSILSKIINYIGTQLADYD